MKTNLTLLLFCIGRCCASDLMLLVPGSENQLVPVEEKEMGSIAAKQMIGALNKLLASNDKSNDGYRKYFGVERLGSTLEEGKMGVSGFLDCLFFSVARDSDSASKVSLRLASTAFCWRLGTTGDYIDYATMIKVEGSRISSAVLIFTLEVLESPKMPRRRVASISPGLFFVSLCEKRMSTGQHEPD